MKLYITILAGAVAVSALALSCSDDESGGGTGGTGTGATGGKGGAGGTGGKGGSGGSSTTGGTGGSAIACDTPEGIAECKRIGEAESVACTELRNCGCDNCTCQLEECRNDPLCFAVTECVIRTKCCATTAPTNCPAGAPDCLDADAGAGACAAEVAAAGASISLALAVGQCIATPAANCAYCP